MKGILKALTLTAILGGCATTQPIEKEPTQPYKSPTHDLTFITTEDGQLIKDPQIPEEMEHYVPNRGPLVQKKKEKPQPHWKVTYPIADCNRELRFGAKQYKKTRREVASYNNGTPEHLLEIEKDRPKEHFPGFDQAQCVIARPSRGAPIALLGNLPIPVKSRERVCYDYVHVYPSFEQPSYVAIERECSTLLETFVNVTEFAIDRRQEHGGSDEQYVNRSCFTVLRLSSVMGDVSTDLRYKCFPKQDLKQKRGHLLPPYRLDLKEILDEATMQIIRGTLQ